MKKEFTLKRCKPLPLMGALLLLCSAPLPGYASDHERAGERSPMESELRQSPPASRREIKGVVKDEAGDPLPRVFVRIKGTKQGTTTDIDGAYTIRVSGSKDILVFSMIGMRSVEKTVGKENTINIVLKEAVSEVSEVVVTGIFKRAKESYTGSVSTVSREQLKSFKGQNLLQTLKNIDSSVNFPTNNTTGSDPNRLPNINIRGGSTLPSIGELEGTARQEVNIPLIIMDGFPISLQKLMDFNDDEIESISILKDASATSIYGSRGANGVIVITTREPEPGALKIQGSMGIHLELPDLTSYKLLNSREKLSLEKFIGLYHDENSPQNDLRLQQIYNERLKDVLNGTDIDWIHIPVQTGIGQRYGVRIDGGSKEFRWSTSSNYSKILGVMEGSDRTNFLGDVTLIYNYKDLIFRNSINVGSTKAKESKHRSFSSYVSQQPYNNPYDEYGNLRKNFPNFTNTNTVSNPLWDTNLNSFDTKSSFNFIDNFSLDWLFTENLRVRAQIGVQYMQSEYHQFYPPEHTYFDQEEYRTPEGLYRRGTYLYNPSKSISTDGRATLSYSRLFDNKHQIYTGIDVSGNTSIVTSYEVKGEGFSNQHLSLLGNARQFAKNTTPKGTEQTSRRLGFTGTFNYVYDNRLFVDGSYRIDGSSDFGANKRWAPFWSIGTGWNVHNEPWMRDNKYINILRLKGSMGDVGQVNFRKSQVQTTYVYNTNNQYFNWVAAELSGWGNPDLTWQITRNYSTGVEVGIFKNWVNLSLDVYTKKTNNLLSSLSLPGAAGFSSYTANVGSVGSSGYELRTNVYVLRDYDRDMRLQIGAQLTHNNSRIIELSRDVKEQQQKRLESPHTDVGRFLYEGMPVNSLYAVRSLGIDPAYGNDIFLNKNGDITNQPLPSDKVYLGVGEPTYRGIANVMFYWKGLSMNLSANYHWGGYLYNSTLQDRVEVSRSTIQRSNVDERVLLKRWKQPGDIVFFKNFDDVTDERSSRFVMKDNVFELASFSVQYRWDSDFVKKNLKLRSLNLSLNMNNLGYFSSIKMERGTAYPFSRTLIGTVTLYY